MINVCIEYEILLNQFKAVLKGAKLKFTSQREALLRTMYENAEHFTPEQLCAKLKETCGEDSIGIATVYRTLNLLEESGMVTSINFGAAGKKFELANKPHHDHLICKKCGKIIEFSSEVIEREQIEIARARNFKLDGHLQQLYGLCGDCHKGDAAGAGSAGGAGAAGSFAGAGAAGGANSNLAGGGENLAGENAAGENAAGAAGENQTQE